MTLSGPVTKTVALGAEFDEALKGHLIERLKSLGAMPLSADWSLVGSQELNRLSVGFKGEVLSIESETFIGLSISGPEELVDEIITSLGKLAQRP